MLRATNRVPVATGDAILTRPACHMRSTRTSSSLNCKNRQTSQYCLSGKAFRSHSMMRCWGCLFDEAPRRMHRRAGTPERIASLRTVAAGSLLRAEAAEFFRAQTLPPARSLQDSLFW
ncbi:MAG: hypothetical protein QOH56_4048, partial [Pseudonocardiales bacterium]|nr:hypothetical protein [Pseudonocardiales bacterium]